jgi:hypothetical protein
MPCPSGGVFLCLALFPTVTNEINSPGTGIAYY